MTVDLNTEPRCARRQSKQNVPLGAGATRRNRGPSSTPMPREDGCSPGPSSGYALRFIARFDLGVSSLIGRTLRPTLIGSTWCRLFAALGLSHRGASGLIALPTGCRARWRTATRCAASYSLLRLACSLQQALRLQRAFWQGVAEHPQPSAPRRRRTPLPPACCTTLPPASCRAVFRTRRGRRSGEGRSGTCASRPTPTGCAATPPSSATSASRTTCQR